jgi:hypothetical protein
MNLFKTLLLSFFVFGSVFFNNSSALAATPTLVGTVNIQDAKIISQEGNNFKLSFVITNREGTQTGVKYAVSLVSQKEKIQTVVDQKVYEEVLTLPENSTITKEISYVAPQGLNGEYMLYVNNQNADGFPFGIGFFGKVSLLSSLKGVEVLPESCYLTVAGEKSEKHYGLTDGVDIDATETLRLACVGTNKSNSTISITPTFETRSRSAFGDIVPAIGGYVAPITFSKAEKKSFSFALPKAATPQSYNLKVMLSSLEGVTTTINVHYIIRGVQASIHNVSLDKNSYVAGETAVASLIWSQASGQFLRNSSGLNTSITMDAKIVDGYGVGCAQPISQELKKDLTSPVTQISIPITVNCQNPQISMSLKDSNGTVLDKKEFNFKTGEMTQSERPKSMPWTPIIIALVIIIGAAVVINRRKNTIAKI